MIGFMQGESHRSIRAAYRKSNGLVTFAEPPCMNVVAASLRRGNVAYSCTATPTAPCRVCRGHSGRSRKSGTLAGINRVTYVAHRMNERRIADFSSQASDENLHQLGVIFVRVLPYPFA